LSKAKTSKPESSATKPQPLPLAAFDKLYWLRIGFAALAGFAAETLVGMDYTSGISLGIAMYLVSYYVARFTWYRGVGKEGQGKIYTTGIGGFVLVFLFTWMLFFTVQIVGYPV
jgi:hypothetical protein